VKDRKTKYRGIFVMISLLLAGTAQAFNLGNMMNPSKWMGSNSDDNYNRRDYPGYGYGGPGWGYPGYGYGGPGWGYPGYGYGAPGWGYPGYGAPGYGYPGYGAGAAPSQGSPTQREIQ
jgi:hypothetical protein